MALPNPHHRTLDEILETALALRPEQREVFLRQLAEQEGEAAAHEIRELIHHANEAPAVLESVFHSARGEAGFYGGGNGNSGAPDDNLPPAAFGPYRVIRHLASGGMGSVYEAVRGEDFQKRVAIKVANTPIASDFWNAQLRRERQILAGLDHPNIAKLLDGGSTPDGLPYLVIEYVEGEPITVYSSRRKLTVTEQVDLFRRVCAAVSFAHQNLVVHRDLKPGNILVTASGTPMLLDFGVAKLVNTADAQKSPADTRSAAPFLTPDYCTPEQLTGKAITTRTDVCQLGLLFVHLLSGRPPRSFGAHPPALSELMETVCKQPVPLPSELLSGDAFARKRQQVAGDLDAIASKATQIDPRLRYDSVDRMVEDLERWSAGMPVEARPQTFLYRLGKLARRRSRLLAAGTLLFLVAAAGITAYVQQSQLARQRFDASRALASQMLFEQQDQLEKLPGTSAVRDQLATNALNYLNRLSEGGSMTPDLREELIRGYSRLAQLRNGELLDTSKAAEAAARGLALASPLSTGQRDRLQLELAVLYAVRGVTNRTGPPEMVLADLELSKKLSNCTPETPLGCQKFAGAVEQISNIHLRNGRPQQAWRAIEDLRRAATGMQADEGLADYLRVMLGIVEMHYFQSTAQFDESEFAGIRQFPAARRLAASRDLSIDRERAICFLWSHWLGYASSNNNKSHSDLAGLAEEAWNAHTRLLARDPTQARLRQLLTKMAGVRAMALERTPARHKEAAGWYEKAFEMALEDYAARKGTAQAVPLFDIASEAVGYYFDRADLRHAAEPVALRLAAVHDLNINAMLPDFPRPEAARKLQAYWWLARRAIHWKSPGIEAHKQRALREAELVLRPSSGKQLDPVTLAACAYILEDFGGAAQKTHATALWQQVLVAVPGHVWIRQRVEAGAAARHPRN